MFFIVTILVTSVAILLDLKGKLCLEHIVLRIVGIHFRCREAVSAYLTDTDPDAILSIGADMRKIQACFSILKVSISCTIL